MKGQKRQWIIDLFTILAMMATVILLCHPIGRNWTEEEIDRYVGTDGDYSPDVDTYYYLRKAKEFSRGGIGSITLVVYRAEDQMCTTGETIAKEANGAMPMLLPASAALAWYGLRAVGIDVSIYDVTIRFCSFLLSLFVIPVYFFLRKRTSWTAAVLGSFLVTLEVPFFRHSHVGFFDTDAMIGLLALVLVLSLFECVVEKNRKRQIAYGIIALAALILLRFTWTAFFIYGVIAVGTVVMGLIGVRLCGRFQKKHKEAFKVPAIVLFAIIAASLALGWNAFVSLAKGFVSAPSGAANWPSETLNISELGKIPLSDADSFWYYFLEVGLDVSTVTGGILALTLLVVSTIICVFQLVRLIRRRSGDTEKVFLLTALLTWLFGAVVLAFFGQRYMEFVTLPSAIVAGLGFDIIRQFCKNRTTAGKRILYVLAGCLAFCGMILRFPIAAVIISAMIFVAGWFLSRQKSGAVLSVVLALVIVMPIGISCVVICAQETPNVERPVENAMIWLRENTASDAVIADFWNLSYTYQYYGERRTLADGGTYNGQFFYWLATMLITDDERLSVGIAEMLQHCGIDGSEYAQELTGSAEETRILLKAILPLSREDAESKLRNEKAFSEEQIKKLLDYTHPENVPDIYFVASHNTFEVIASLMVYRNWEDGGTETPAGTYYSAEAGSRPEAGEAVPVKLVLGSDPSLSPLLAAIEISGGELKGCIVLQDGTMVDCGRQIYMKNGEVIYDRTTAGLPGEQNLFDEEAMILIEEDGLVSVVMLEKRTADSTFLNLFLLNGMNQDVFEKVYESEHGQSVQDRIADNSSSVIWKINSER
ncbi:MAG: hypothetical protein J5738_02615 [Lachnospiraceae bacterium]|nr:hypothetical protein [Lachnospiraceae bacterium]